MSTESSVVRMVPTSLAVLNSHPRDASIEFEEIAHKYTICGEEGYTSVTTWNHSHFPHFDAESIVRKILANRQMSNPEYKYYGMTRESILASWDANRDSASSAGTAMHYDIECYYNGIYTGNTSIEFKYFMDFVKDHSHLIPYRTEWCVFHEELKIAGSIDMIFENPDGSLLIYDWKRVKEISYDSAFGKFATTDCISHMPDTNFWHYSLQLNMYKTILEIKYGKTVSGMYLVCLHPDNVSNSYELLEVPVISSDISALMSYRLDQLVGECNVNFVRPLLVRSSVFPGLLSG